MSYEMTEEEEVRVESRLAELRAAGVGMNTDDEAMRLEMKLVGHQTMGLFAGKPEPVVPEASRS